MAKKPDCMSIRFWPKVNVLGETQCWNWMASIKPNGYGQIGRGGRGAGVVYAHRASWELVNGKIPDGLQVLHHCDNRRCVNPSHLFLGTQKDNIRDMLSKGRHISGFPIWKARQEGEMRG